jgi:hypothetical protein
MNIRKRIHWLLGEADYLFTVQASTLQLSKRLPADKIVVLAQLHCNSNVIYWNNKLQMVNALTAGSLVATTSAGSWTTSSLVTTSHPLCNRS